MIIPVRGRSMLPSLRDGDLVEIDVDRVPRPGDVALYLSGTTTVLHRVLRTGDRILLQGDACARPDAPIDPTRILGTARLRRRPLLAATRSLLDHVRGLARRVRAGARARS